MRTLSTLALGLTLLTTPAVAELTSSEDSPTRPALGTSEEMVRLAEDVYQQRCPTGVQYSVDEDTVEARVGGRYVKVSDLRNKDIIEFGNGSMIVADEGLNFMMNKLVMGGACTYDTTSKGERDDAYIFNANVYNSDAKQLRTEFDWWNDFYKNCE
ncbi:hypothetical protein GOV11_00660 [Candidatus Woesearchaeota archaeon]|nr:hypothetical protein [Candidatus Woesearchaeota archaeon]